MQIDAIRAFVLLCEDLNITRVSEKIHISQQGLSRQLKALEKELGTTLFFRSSKSLTLTESGQLLLPHYKKIVQEYEKSMLELDLYKKEKPDSWRIAVCSGIKNTLGLSFFYYFQDAHPEICLEFDFDSDDNAEKRLYAKQVDAAFLDWPRCPQKLNSIPILKSRLVAVVRKDHPFAAKKAVSMEEMKGQRIYIPDKSHRMHQRFEEHWPEIYDSVILDFITNDYDTYFLLPKKVGGIALTFHFLCKNLDEELVEIPIIEDSYVAVFYSVNKDVPLSKAGKLFEKYIKKNWQFIGD